MVVILVPRFAAAEPCAPAATLSGDPALVASVGQALAADGVAAPTEGCPAVLASVKSQGGAIDVTIDHEGASVDRVVDAPALAATVIESWARTDVDAPLLAARPAPPPPVVVATAAPVPQVDAPPRVVVVAAPPVRGIHLVADVETSLASDRTTWFGPSVGACVGLGPMCAAVRVRFASVIEGPDTWNDQLQRRGAEVLVGGDLPFSRGRTTITPGIAMGLGWEHTHVDGAGWHTGSETGGLRAEVHGGVSYRVWGRLALDLSLAIELTQATHVESDTTMPIPDEARMFGRVGVGVRWGRL
jgi:hypothetical protein